MAILKSYIITKYIKIYKEHSWYLPEHHVLASHLSVLYVATSDVAIMRNNFNKTIDIGSVDYSSLNVPVQYCTELFQI